MDIIHYLLLLIFSFSGIIIGILLSNMAVEEIKDATKYLKYLNIIILTLIILISTYSTNKLYSIIITTIILTTLIITINRQYNKWSYASLSALLYISTLNAQAIYITILIFIYGISIITIDANKYFKNKINGKIKSYENIELIKKSLLKYHYYLLVGIIVYTVFTYLI